MQSGGLKSNRLVEDSRILALLVLLNALIDFMMVSNTTWGLDREDYMDIWR